MSVMSLFFSVVMIPILVNLVVIDSKTSNCNYAIDLWWLTANPPSPSPTASPSKSPTDTPTQAPTNLDETRTTLEEGEINDIDYDVLEPLVASGISTTLLLNPYPIDSCYSFNFNDEPFNTVSVQYSCKSGENTLIRNIYWNSLECDGNEVETTEITESQQGTYATFVCDAETNCPAASIAIQPALTTSPTPEPTDSPTTAPPTKAPVRVDNTAIEEGTVNDDDEVTINISIFESSGECDGALGPNTDSEQTYQWRYAQNICIDITDLQAFVETPSPTVAPSTRTPTEANNIIVDVDEDEDEVQVLFVSQSDDSELVSIGWFCRDNRYVFGTYNNSDCEGDVIDELASYTNDWCAFGSSAWSYVECVPTAAPTNAPTPTSCSGDSDCDTDELCVTANGQCTSKIVDEDCGGDTDCNDGYKCNTEHAFCYFSECDPDGGCAEYTAETTMSYTCETYTTIVNGNGFSYGLCEVIPSDNDGVYCLSCFTATCFVMSVVLVFSVNLM